MRTTRTPSKLEATLQAFLNTNQDGVCPGGSDFGCVACVGPTERLADLLCAYCGHGPGARRQFKAVGGLSILQVALLYVHEGVVAGALRVIACLAAQPDSWTCVACPGPDDPQPPGRTTNGSGVAACGDSCLLTSLLGHAHCPLRPRLQETALRGLHRILSASPDAARQLTAQAMRLHGTAIALVDTAAAALLTDDLGVRAAAAKLATDLARIAESAELAAASSDQCPSAAANCTTACGHAALGMDSWHAGRQATDGASAFASAGAACAASHADSAATGKALADVLVQLRQHEGGLCAFLQVLCALVQTPEGRSYVSRWGLGIHLLEVFTAIWGISQPAGTAESGIDILNRVHEPPAAETTSQATPTGRVSEAQAVDGAIAPRQLPDTETRRQCLDAMLVLLKSPGSLAAFTAANGVPACAGARSTCDRVQDTGVTAGLAKVLELVRRLLAAGSLHCISAGVAVVATANLEGLSDRYLAAGWISVLTCVAAAASKVALGSKSVAGNMPCDAASPISQQATAAGHALTAATGQERLIAGSHAAHTATLHAMAQTFVQASAFQACGVLREVMRSWAALAASDCRMIVAALRDSGWLQVMACVLQSGRARLQICALQALRNAQDEAIGYSDAGPADCTRVASATWPVGDASVHAQGNTGAAPYADAVTAVSTADSTWQLCRNCDESATAALTSILTSMLSLVLQAAQTPDVGPAGEALDVVYEALVTLRSLLGQSSLARALVFAAPVDGACASRLAVQLAAALRALMQPVGSTATAGSLDRAAHSTAGQREEYESAVAGSDGAGDQDGEASLAVGVKRTASGGCSNGIIMDATNKRRRMQVEAAGNLSLPLADGPDTPLLWQPELAEVAVRLMGALLSGACGHLAVQWAAEADLTRHLAYVTHHAILQAASEDRICDGELDDLLVCIFDILANLFGPHDINDDHSNATSNAATAKPKSAIVDPAGVTCSVLPTNSIAHGAASHCNSASGGVSPYNRPPSDISFNGSAPAKVHVHTSETKGEWVVSQWAQLQDGLGRAAPGLSVDRLLCEALDPRLAAAVRAACLDCISKLLSSRCPAVRLSMWTAVMGAPATGQLQSGAELSGHELGAQLSQPCTQDAGPAAAAKPPNTNAAAENDRAGGGTTASHGSAAPAAQPPDLETGLLGALGCACCRSLNDEEDEVQEAALKLLPALYSAPGLARGSPQMACLHEYLASCLVRMLQSCSPRLCAAARQVLDSLAALRTVSPSCCQDANDVLLRPPLQEADVPCGCAGCAQMVLLHRQCFPTGAASSSGAGAASALRSACVELSADGAPRIVDDELFGDWAAQADPDLAAAEQLLDGLSATGSTPALQGILELECY